ncbi:hypothetical protein JCM11251_003966 [Rhodosporidiobolus azoricus]
MSTRHPHPSGACQAPYDPIILPFPLLRTALQKCMAAIAPQILIKDALSPQQHKLEFLKQFVSPDMEHAYENSHNVRKAAIEAVADAVEDRFTDPAYTAWSREFDALLLRYRLHHSSSHGSFSLAPLSAEMQLWADNRKMENRIRFVAISEEEKRELVHGMEDLKLYFEREYKAKKQVTFKEIRAIAKRYGAFEPLPQHGHAHEQVQHPVERYFGGSSSGRAGAAGTGW